MTAPISGLVIDYKQKKEFGNKSKAVVVIDKTTVVGQREDDELHQEGAA